MLMLVKIFIFIIISYCVPYLLGMLLSSFAKEENNQIILNLLYGYMIIWGVLQFITVPAIYTKCSFSIYAIITYSLIIIGCFISVFINKTRFIKTCRETILWIKNKHWLTIVSIFLIIVQTCYISLANLVDFDDAFYVATSETALETNTLMEYNPYTGVEYSSFPSRYVLSPFPLYISLISNLLQIRAATTAHTLLALILIPLSYMIWYLIGKQLFSKDENKAATFLLLVMTILIYSGYSVYTQGTFMHVRIWQGKATLTAIILPFIFYLGLCIYQRHMQKTDWIILLLTMSASCFVSSMGIILAAIMLGIIALTDAIIHKSIQNWKYIIPCFIPNILFSIIYLFIR